MRREDREDRGLRKGGDAAAPAPPPPLPSHSSTSTDSGRGGGSAWLLGEGAVSLPSARPINTWSGEPGGVGDTLRASWSLRANWLCRRAPSTAFSSRRGVSGTSRSGEDSKERCEPGAAPRRDAERLGEPPLLGEANGRGGAVEDGARGKSANKGCVMTPLPTATGGRGAAGNLRPCENGCGTERRLRAPPSPPPPPPCK